MEKAKMVKLLLDLNLQPGVAIFLVALVVILCIVGIFLLQNGIRRDRNKLIAEKYKIKELDRDGFEEMLKHKYSTADENTHFTVFLLNLVDSENVKSSIGERQYKHLIETLRERLIRVIPHGSKICAFDEGKLIVFVEEDMDNIGITNVAAMCIAETVKPVTLLTKVKLNVKTDIGVASYNEFSPNSEQLLQNVQLALSTAQKSGVNKFTIYSAELAEKQTDEYKQYQDIKTAIAQNQFVLYFQPIYDLDENKIISYEVLVRWQHPRLGILTPSHFLPLMEQSGDINWIGSWVFEEMLKIMTAHFKTHPEDSNLIFTFNLSPKQLMYPHLAEDLRKIYKKYKISAENICLEIVEFSIFDKVPEVASNILKLRQMGFKIAIDDFGTEMSSLKMLENVSCDYVKLDRKFVEQAQDDYLIDGVIETLVRFAEHKHLKIIAEGIEDEVILEYVKGLNIHIGQGYHFGKPLPPEKYGL
jgi:EAL domain-containing protein (putative c-di-GMP-specific phosphodiesterase class I)/GGDEF domain-containing protein